MIVERDVGHQRVGAVVIGRNEGRRLLACLDSISPYVATLVYVDSGSTDGSVAAARRAGAFVVELDMSRPFTAARARNAGFEQLIERDCAADFVQFVDGDCELDSQWLSAALPFLSFRPDVALVCGRLRERFPENSVYNLLCDMEWDTPVGEISECGGIFLVRTKAFNNAGGFSAHLIAGEEPELCARLRAEGWKIWRLNTEMARHDAAILRFRQWWLRMIRGGYAYAEVSRMHQNASARLWRRNFYRSVIWGGVLPTLIMIGALIHPAAIFAAAIYPAQIIKTALRGPHKGWQGLIYGTFMMIGKFAELVGIAKFYGSLASGRAHPLIEYK